MPKFVIANFHRYHPADRDLTSSQRGGNGKLKWVRLETDWDHDEDIALLPWDERSLWPWFLARAGKGNPVGSVSISVRGIAELTSLSEEKVAHAIRYLRARGRIEPMNTDQSGPKSSRKNVTGA